MGLAPSLLSCQLKQAGHCLPHTEKKNFKDVRKVNIAFVCQGVGIWSHVRRQQKYRGLFHCNCIIFLVTHIPPPPTPHEVNNEVSVTKLEDLLLFMFAEANNNRVFIHNISFLFNPQFTLQLSFKRSVKDSPDFEGKLAFCIMRKNIFDIFQKKEGGEEEFI